MENGFKKKIVHKLLFSLEVSLVLVLLLTVLLSFSGVVFAVIGQPNATVTTLLEVGNVYPEVLFISVNEGVSINLNPNTTRLVSCLAVVRDWNGEETISNVTGEFFDTVASGYGQADANNEHYTNNSCNISTAFSDYHGFVDDAYTSLANCTFAVNYYANPQRWNCTVVVNDTYNWKGNDTNTTNISQLLAIGLPDQIDYGTVNATFVSDEQVANATNLGNVEFNLSLSGYARTEGDNYAMNCTLGSLKNISISHERYNLTEPTAGDVSFSDFGNTYLNLTSAPVTKRFNLNYKQDDTPIFALNSTYWRIYVPVGVAGTCRGNIIFGATQGSGD